MTTYIPIYAEYCDDKNNVITKEISYKGGEIGIHITVEDLNSSIKIRYVPSKIKMAASMVREWANENKIMVNFSTYIFSRQLFNLLSKKLENEYEQLLWVTTTFLLSIKDRKKIA